MQSKNAISNLKNRYVAVLKKCRLLNTFGTLALAGLITCFASPALAIQSVSDGNQATFKNALANILDDDINVTSTIYFNQANQSYGNLTEDFDIRNAGIMGLFGEISATNLEFNNLDFENFTHGVFQVQNGNSVVMQKVNFSNNITTNSNYKAGAIHNFGNLTIIDTDFENNSSNQNATAGAIFNENNAVLTIVAQNDDVEFERNFVNSTSNAITNYGILNLNSSSTNNKITLDDSVVNGATGNIIINKGYSGTVEFNNGLMASSTGVGNVVLENGLAKFAKTTQINSLTVNGGRISTQDNGIYPMTVNTINGSSPLNLSIDVDASQKTSDAIFLTNQTLTQINIESINLLNPTSENNFSVDPFVNITPTNVSYTGGSVISPLYTYSVTYDTNKGLLSFASTKEVNPSVQTSAVSTINANMSQMATNSRAFTRTSRIMALPNNERVAYLDTLYAVNDESALSLAAKPQTQGAWIEPHFNMEKVNFENAAEFDYTSYGFAGGYDTAYFQLGALDTLFGAYLDFSMSESENTNNELSQMEISLGGSATFFVNNFYFGSTANIGYGSNEMSNKSANNIYYGDANYNTLNFGFALIAGYSLEMGNFMLQPKAMLSYARISEADYTTKSGAKVIMEAVNSFELTPALRVAMNFDNATQIYADAKVIIPINNDAKVSVAGINAPEISQSTYSEIALGVQKDWSKFSLYGEGYGKIGDREGLGASLGFKFYF